MVAKIGRGENLLGALLYNQEKVEKENGHILFTHNIAETWNNKYSVSELARSFQPYLLANNKTEKPILHISLNPDPKDVVTDEQFTEIAQHYMQEMGYKNQPYIIFKHTDIDRTHIHIVSVCIDENGKKISDKFEKRHSMKVCRDIERIYTLFPAIEKQNEQKEKIFRPVNYEKGDLKSKIAAVIRHLPMAYRFQSFGEYNALLSLFNITAEEIKGQIHGIEKEGIVYFALNEKGEKCSNPFKSSLFGKKAGHSMLKNHWKNSEDSLRNEPGKYTLKTLVELAKNTCNDEVSFHRRLLEQGINTVVRKNEKSRIYGITFIDHNSKIVCNGSRLGKELSAGMFNEWWNNGHKPKTLNPNERISNGHVPEVNSYTAKNHRDPFELLSTFSLREESTSADLLEDLGGWFPEAHGEDYEELAFENRIKKKKRKGT